MQNVTSAMLLGLVLSVVGAEAATAAVTPEQKCQAGKTVEAGKYASCLTKARGKLVTSLDQAKYDAAVAKCAAKLAKKYTSLEDKAVSAGTMCPTEADIGDLEGLSADYAAAVDASLGGTRYVDNGDGTISDLKTGLMWEKKSNDGGIHDKDNVYSWSAGSGMPYRPDGTAHLAFLATLNGGYGGGGENVCFAGHCDWRMPTAEELEGILLEPAPCATDPCVDPAFDANCSGSCSVTECSCTEGYYWSASTYGLSPNTALVVVFSNGIVAPGSKYLNPFKVRAVRSGL